MTREGLIERIRQEDCLVFGTGFVATLFRDALDAAGIESHVRGYLASSPAEGETLYGKEVRAAADKSVDRSALICVAVHESNLASVEELLLREEYSDVVWVYPLIFEMVWGEPLYRNVSLPIEMILERQDRSHNWIAVRALASRGILEGDISAKDTYVATMAQHCGLRTAERRHEALRRLIASMEETGFDEQRPILVDTNLSIIDGLHRLAVAWTLGINRIPCDIVRTSNAFDRLLTDKNKLTYEQLVQAGLGAQQLAKVATMRKQIAPKADDTTPEVTFIIPAYNVADYIDQCMESVARQTFGDFEVLLIDDGSTDTAARACDEWSSRDARVRAIHKPNGGVSSCRNLGMELARGRYLAFVDSDDWLDEFYLEKLHAAAVDEDALLTECDIWRYDNRTGRKIHRRCGQRMGVRHSLEEHMRLGPTASYKAISRRSLWLDNDVRFPECPFESPAIYALLVALAGERWAYVPEPLYYYRRFRPNSLVETAYAKKPGVADNTLGVEAMAYLCEQFRRHGIYEQFEDVLPSIVTYRLNDILAMQYHRRSPEDFAELVANQRAFLAEAFPGLEHGAYVTWGGYNLNRIMQHLPLLNDPSCRFNFSSITAVALGKGTAEAAVLHPNRYREMMVGRELRQELWDVLAKQDPRFVFIDFIEERFDLIECDGRYVTASDAFDGAHVEGLKLGRRIPFGSAEHLSLWRRAFGEFVRHVRHAAPRARLVVVEDYLSERVGTMQRTRPFDHLDEIAEKNRVLKTLYDQAHTLEPNAAFVPASLCANYFTDEGYEYGAVPQHLNDIVNQRIARLIEETVL